MSSRRRASRNAAPRPAWARSIPRRDVPPKYHDLFKRIEPERALKIAADVHKKAVEGRALVVIALMDHGLSVSRAFDYMRAGRWLYHFGGALWRRRWARLCGPCAP